MKRKRFFLNAAWVVLFLAILTGIIEVRAGEQLELARAARDRGDYRTAVVHYSRSLHWYVPWGSAEKSAEELLDLGLSLAKQGRETEAAAALSRMRSGLYGARGLYTPRLDLIARAEPHLAGLRARAKLGPQASPEALDKQARVYLSLMRRPSRPATGAALAAVGGFFIWTGAALAFIMAYFRVGVVPRKSVRIWPLVWAAGFILWLWGLKWA